MAPAKIYPSHDVLVDSEENSIKPSVEKLATHVKIASMEDIKHI